MKQEEEKMASPEEMYQRIYKRITTLGDAIIKNYPRVEYQHGASYALPCDKGQEYVFHMVTKVENMTYYSFIRRKDSQKATITQYSYPLEKIN